MNGHIYRDKGEDGYKANQGLKFVTYNTANNCTDRLFYPSKVTLGIQDVDLDSGRSAAGTMIRYRKAEKRSLSLTFPPMTTEDMHEVLLAVSTFDSSMSVGSGTKSFFKVVYTDPLSGNSNYRDTRYFYAGDRTAPCYNEDMGLWEEMTVDLVER